jgi:putative ABC transport system substrate-binding protein
VRLIPRALVPATSATWKGRGAARAQPSVGRESADVQAIARKFGLEVALHEARRAEDFASVFEAIEGQADALYVVENALMVSNRALIVMLALKTHLPTTFATGDSARAGGLMACGPDISAPFRGATEQVDKILRGTSPGDLPVE